MSAKTIGQERSLFDLDETAWDKFLGILTRVPVGHQVTVNGLRDALDAATNPTIPNKTRGGLFARAARAGLITPVFTEQGYEVRLSSSGASAHQATVRLYTRTVPS